VISPKAFKEDYTIVSLSYIGYDEHNNIVENVPFLCNTLDTSKDEAISKGKYKVIINLSYKFNRELPLLLDVPNCMAKRYRKWCILVGINDKAGWLRNSAQYEQEIVELIKQYRECWITVV
jgi:hypothetical protein